MSERMASERLMSDKLELKKTTNGPSLKKGLVAGLLGGLAGTAAKTVAERVYLSRAHGQKEPPELVVERSPGRGLMRVRKKIPKEALQWGFGAAIGAAYGVAVEYYPPASAKDGAGIGMALSSMTYDTVLPAVGLAPDPAEQDVQERTTEMTMHVVFGAVTETVRRAVRRMLR